MANQVAARLSGDDYQHLYGWQFVLELMMPNRGVRQVTIEDPDAGSIDDVTVRHAPEAPQPDTFHQVKFHVDHRSAYSTEALLEHESRSTSLLLKFWSTWQQLRTERPGHPIELWLVSNWGWSPDDPVRKTFDGHEGRLTEAFLTASARTTIGKRRRQWQSALGADGASFAEFVACLRFRVGYACTAELERHVADRMEFLGLRSDSAALLIAAGIVRKWIKSRQAAVSLAELEASLVRHDLHRPKDAERGVAVYLTTVSAQRFEIDPDYLLDWRSHFTGEPGPRGHQLTDPSGWNARLLPELRMLAERVGSETDCRLVRARGLARLSAWFAFGHAFSSVARYTIEVDQNGRLWRTDAEPSPDLPVLITSAAADPLGEPMGGSVETVAVGLSVTGSLEADVRAYLAGSGEAVGALLLLRPRRELGRDCLRSASDVVALADGFKSLTRCFVQHWHARRLLLFYFGPLSGACFIGHQLNALCPEVQIMEDQQPGYAPSFLLT